MKNQRRTTRRVWSLRSRFLRWWRGDTTVVRSEWSHPPDIDYERPPVLDNLGAKGAVCGWCYQDLEGRHVVAHGYCSQDCFMIARYAEGAP
jgi:hypothetical protein